MALKTMYPPQKDSPSTFLLGDITATDVLLTVGNAAILPQITPYPLTLGIDKNLTETVMVTTINLGSNQLTVTRGTPALAWQAGAKVARVFNAKDLKDLQDNVIDISSSLGDVEAMVADQTVDIEDLKTTVGDAGSGLVKGLADEVTRATGAEAAETLRATGAEDNLNTIKVNRSELAQVITDLVYSADGTQVLVTITRYNASNQQTTQYTRNLPVVSDETMGVMTPEAYSEISALRNDVNALQQIGGRFIGVSFATKAALDSYVIPESVKMGDFTYVLDDETKDDSTTRYVFNGVAFDFAFVINYDPIGIADSTTPGLVKSDGGSTDGKVFVETDGTMSVIGWGRVAGVLDTHDDDIAALQLAVANGVTKPYVDAFNIAPTADGTGTAITINVDSILMVNGGKVSFIASANNNGAPTTINGMPLYKPNTTVAPNIVAGKMYTVWFESGGSFFLQASAEGTAVAGNVLAGKTFSNDDDTGVSGRLMVGEGSYAPDIMKPWTLRTSAANNLWNSVCYGNGLFVAVADSGTDNRVMTSPDGITWTLRTSAADNSWRSVCYGNGLFVAVANSGTGNRVMTSPDGITWTLRTSAANNLWNSVCYGNGLFVAVANSGTGNRVMTSPDGINWSSRTSAANNDWYSVCYGNGLFVAVAWSGTDNRVMTSPDGITWSSRTSAANNDWNSVCYGNGLFVAVASTGTGNRVMTSPDGINWTIRTSAADNLWISVCYGNGMFVAVTNSGTGNRVMTSPDGITWTLRTSAANNDWRSVCYGNGLFVAVAKSGTGNRVMTMDYSLEEVVNKRPTGLLPLRPWTSRTSAADNAWYSVCYGNGMFVAVTNSGTGNRVMTSPDGINWTIRTSAANNLWNSVCYGNGLFVAVADSGTDNRVMTSPDGITWTLRTSAADNDWRSVCYGNGLFVAVASTGIGTGNRVMTSPDGINWTIRTSAADNLWRSVCYGKGLFVAVANSGTGNRVMTSPDGINWSSRTSAANNAWYSVCYGNGLFVAVASTGTDNRVMTSPDGITWSSRTSAADNLWYSVCYGNGMFVAVTNSGTGNRVMTSPDGITWTLRTSAANNDWNSVCYGNGLFVAVASTGTDNRVMTANITRQELPGTSKSIQSLGQITATYVSATSVTFPIKSYVEDYSILTIDNIVAQFQNIQKVTTAYAVTLTWAYSATTGILTCTASSNLFASGTTTAKIWVFM